MEQKGLFKIMFVHFILADNVKQIQYDLHQ